MKRCSRCKEEKDEGEFCKCATSNDGLYCYCKACRADIGRKNRVKYKNKIANYHKEYQAKNKDKMKFIQDVYKKKYPEKVAACKKKSRQLNIYKYRLFDRIESQRRRDILADNYVASRICQGTKLRSSDITPELIEVKRLIIKTKRLCKQQSQTSQNLETV